MLSELTERRVSLAVAVAAVVVFVALLLAAQPFYPSFDEWKYFGIGYQFWAGHGITTVFGGLFLLHGPVWPIVVTAPHVFLGLDTASWGRFLDGVSGTAIVALAGWFGWRIRPSAGALAAVGMVALLYLHDQTRTARLDVPAAAFALLYVAVGFEAVRRGSVRWAISAGVLFAIGFLIKEIVLPFAPVPFLAGVAWGRSWVAVGRVAAWTLLVATVGISWWFALYAIELGRFYRLETPAWTLIPVAIVIVVLIGLGLAGGRIATTRRMERLAASEGVERPDRYARWVIAYGGTAVWAGLQLYAYTKTARLKGGSILTLSQLELYARQWFVPYLLLVAIGAAAILSVAALVAYRRGPERKPMVDLWIASICGAPLVLLVVGVGEPPRNYLAQIALAAGLAGIAVVWAIEWVLSERRWFLTAAAGALAGAAAGGLVFLRLRVHPASLGAVAGAVGGAVVGLLLTTVVRRFPSRLLAWRSPIAAAVLVVGLLAGSTALGVHALVPKAGNTGMARDAAIRTTDDWIRANVAPGTKIAFGSFLGYEMALGLVDKYPVVHGRHSNVISSTSAPEGILRAGEAPSDDWVSVDIAPRNVNEFEAFRAAWLLRDLGRKNVGIWVYSIGDATAAPSVLAAATPENGLTEVAHWTFPVGGRAEPLQTFVYRVDAAHLHFDPNKIFISPEALARLVGLLERNPTAARPAATALEHQIVIVPSSPDDAGLMARLQRLAGG